MPSLARRSFSRRLAWALLLLSPWLAWRAAATVVNSTDRTSAGYAVMGHPGVAPRGYRDFSYRRKLNRGRTKGGSLP